jgi:hypothetical protein
MSSDPSNRCLLLTVDYEIFGNGAGDVRQHMVEPTERMARICEKYSVPLTIFFEVEEYVAFCRQARELERMLGYDPARLIRDQVRSLALRGHDFQLHLHPQWYEAKLEDRRWKLGVKATVDDLFESSEETDRYICVRKALLEELTDGRQVIAYRAGAFSARPGEKLLAALAANDIKFDSSVVRGLFHETDSYHLDYRNVNNSKRLWRVSDDVTREDPNGAVWEVPIHSVPVRRYRQLSVSRLRAKFSNNIPKSQQRQTVQRFLRPRQPVRTLTALFDPVPLKLDFHNQTPAEFCRMIASAEFGNGFGPVDALVAIGHTKEHVDDRTFESLVRGAVEKLGVNIATFDDIAQQLPASDQRLRPTQAV